jgi:hypothetical protein
MRLCRSREALQETKLVIGVGGYKEGCYEREVYGKVELDVIMSCGYFILEICYVYLLDYEI